MAPANLSVPTRIQIAQAISSAELSIRRTNELGIDPRASGAIDQILAGISHEARQRVKTALARAETPPDGVDALFHSEYPSRLAELDHFPAVLFTIGNQKTLTLPSIGVVGTRGASSYGKALAIKFSESLARAGVAVVSGGALGIDACAHRGALQARGMTIAVMACGIDKLYPPANAQLFSQILSSGGCIVSQFPLGEPNLAFRFLMRNHVIAALSDGVLVIEAPPKSGSLTTANAANDMGRQVFVVPGSVGVLNFFGSHALIRNGATLVDHPDQILGDLFESLGVEMTPVAKAGQTGGALIEALSVEALSAESLAARTGLDLSDVLSELTMLELDGRVYRDGALYGMNP